MTLYSVRSELRGGAQDKAPAKISICALSRRCRLRCADRFHRRSDNTRRFFDYWNTRAVEVNRARGLRPRCAVRFGLTPCAERASAHAVRFLTIPNDSCEFARDNFASSNWAGATSTRALVLRTSITRREKHVRQNTVDRWRHPPVPY